MAIRPNMSSIRHPVPVPMEEMLQLVHLVASGRGVCVVGGRVHAWLAAACCG